MGRYLKEKSDTGPPCEGLPQKSPEGRDRKQHIVRHLPSFVNYKTIASSVFSRILASEGHNPHSNDWFEVTEQMREKTILGVSDCWKG